MYHQILQKKTKKNVIFALRKLPVLLTIKVCKLLRRVQTGKLETLSDILSFSMQLDGTTM